VNTAKLKAGGFPANEVFTGDLHVTCEREREGDFCGFFF
jgi:hypothetical protein